ncbi:MAG: divergent polysaccharide deacetylase family protein, partial [Nitrospirae bacterium]|nr:divergent polysaccharide deacetylase family protein [Nitrospirota bacterium]
AKGKKRHILLILLLIAAAVFFLYGEIDRTVIQKGFRELFKPEEKPEALPKIAVVIDDLGPSKKIAQEILSIKLPLTFAILPQETYTAWVADEGSKLGYDILGHIPMEAKEPYKLGKGGLYTWMSDEEIHKTLEEDIGSIPHIIGVSSHMGSAFTEDERAMDTFFSMLKNHGIFFLDSLTTSKSISSKLAGRHGIKFLRRDVFLDEKDTAEDIKAQWEKAVKIAKERGYAILLAHARKNTIEFLKNAGSDEELKEVKIVPVSELYQGR